MHERPPLPIRTELYGTTEDGQEVQRYILTNGCLQISVIEYGAIVEDFVWLSTEGPHSLCRRLDSLKAYEFDTACVGAIVGPFVAYDGPPEQSSSTVDSEQDYEFSDLAGGVQGLHNMVWQGRELVDHRGPCVELETVHEDGMNGYEGNLYIRVRFILGADGICYIEYEALSDDDRPINFTHHIYCRRPPLLSSQNTGPELILNTKPPSSYAHQDLSAKFGGSFSEDAHSNILFFDEAEANMRMLAHLGHADLKLSVHSDQGALYLRSWRKTHDEIPFVCFAPFATAYDADKPCAFVLEPNRLFRQKCQIRVVAT